jgi:general secretion pathway protein D
MKTIILIFLLTISSFSAAQDQPDLSKYFDASKVKKHEVEKAILNDFSLDLKDVNLSQVISLIFFEMNTEDYFLFPEVLEDSRKVSIRWNGKKSNLKSFLGAWLFSLGYDMTDKNKFLTVSKIKEESEKETKQKLITFIYEPKFNSSSNLNNLVSGLIGRSASLSSRSVQTSSPLSKISNVEPKEGTAASVIDREDKFLVFRCTENEKLIIEEVLAVLDVPVPVVSVSGVIYEVALTKNDSSALSLVGSILKNKIGFDFKNSDGQNSFKFSIGGLEAIFSALDSDSRFKVVSSPSLTVRSGASAKLTVGEDVPVAGSITQNNGTTSQSVEYKSSGVILDFSPKVFKEVIRLNFMQTVSSFVKTETGINNSPTLIKREIKTDVDIKDGEVLILGGLTDSKESSGSSSFPFFRSISSKNESKRSSELLIVLKINKV